MHFYSLSFNGDGVGSTAFIPDQTQLTPTWTYREGDYSWLYPQIEEEVLADRIANRIILKVEDPQRQSFAVTLANMDPASPTSIPTLGYTRTKTLNSNTSVDADEAYQRARSELIEASYIYSKKSFTTAINPLHENFEVIGLYVDDIADNYREHNWAIDLTPNGQMTHEVSKLTPVTDTQTEEPI